MFGESIAGGDEVPRPFPCVENANEVGEEIVFAEAEAEEAKKGEEKETTTSDHLGEDVLPAGSCVLEDVPSLENNMTPLLLEEGSINLEEEEGLTPADLAMITRGFNYLAGFNNSEEMQLPSSAQMDVPSVEEVKEEYFVIHFLKEIFFSEYNQQKLKITYN